MSSAWYLDTLGDEDGFTFGGRHLMIRYTTVDVGMQGTSCHQDRSMMIFYSFSLYDWHSVLRSDITAPSFRALLSCFPLEVPSHQTPMVKSRGARIGDVLLRVRLAKIHRHGRDRWTIEVLHATTRCCLKTFIFLLLLIDLNKSIQRSIPFNF